jgi:phenylalanyl-tRNA synthetase beta subunit
MVSEELFEGSTENGVKLKNPLTLDRVYLRNTLVPSILESGRLNKNYENLRLFEIANVYIKNQNGLPLEKLHLAGLVKHPKASFLEGKGTIEQIFKILGIKDFTFAKKDDGILGANIKMGGKKVGKIEKEGDEITFEIDLESLLLNTNPTKKYIKPSKFPPILEDIRVEIGKDFTFEEMKDKIMKISSIISEVSLLDVYQNKKTFHVVFLDKTRNLTSNDITPIRSKIYKMLEDQFEAKIG